MVSLVELDLPRKLLMRFRGGQRYEGGSATMIFR